MKKYIDYFCYAIFTILILCFLYNQYEEYKQNQINEAISQYIELGANSNLLNNTYYFNAVTHYEADLTIFVYMPNYEADIEINYEEVCSQIISLYKKSNLYKIAKFNELDIVIWNLTGDYEGNSFIATELYSTRIKIAMSQKSTPA